MSKKRNALVWVEFPIRLSILGYDTVDQAIDIGNDTEYGLSPTCSPATFRRLARLRRSCALAKSHQRRRRRPDGLFGGYKMSGNRREWGDFAFHEFLETKAVLGYTPKVAAE